MKDHLLYMNLAITEAEVAYREDEVPVGAVMVSKEGYLLGRSRNDKEKAHNPCGHAEINLIQSIAKKNKNWRLTDTTLYVTLEPCPMCLSAMVHARIGLLVFGTYDSKGVALSFGYHFQSDKRLNHQFGIIAGVKHFECSSLMSKFFREKRNQYKQMNQSDNS